MNASTIDISLLGQKIKEKRGDAGYRKTASKIGGITHSVLYNIENGKIPKLESYIRICHWLNLPTDYFTYRFQNNISLTDENSLIKFISSDKRLKPSTAKALMSHSGKGRKSLAFRRRL